MPLTTGLIFGYLFRESERPVDCDGQRIHSWKPGTGWLWIHLDRTRPDTERWLRETAVLDPLVVEALLEVETRPRCVPIGDGLLVILRGVNLNAGADPEDMISVRIWVDAGRVVSLRHRKLMAIQDLHDEIAGGDSPETPGALLVEIADRMLDRMAPVLDDLNDGVDQVEEDVLDSPSHALRTQLSQLRRKAISLRRFLSPQREVLARLQTERAPVLREVDRNRLREITDRLTRHIEELDAARDRAAVTQEELVGRISDQMNRNMYVLSVVAGVFLPLGLLTGLLGINVGGMPGVDNDWAFTIVCLCLLGVAAGVVWLMRRLRLLA